MRKIGLGAVAAVVVAGGAYYGLSVYPSHQFRAQLDQAIAKLPPGYAVHYGALSYSLLTHTAEIGDLSVARAGDASFSASVAHLAVKRPFLDLADSWNKASANPGALKEDQALPVADRISVEGVKFQSPTATVTFRGESVDKLRIYPWALLHPGLPDLNSLSGIFTTLLAQQKQLQDQLKAQQQGTPLDPQAIQQMQKQQFEALIPLIRLESALLLGIGFDGISGDALDVVIPQPATDAVPSGDFHVSMQKLRGGVFDRGVGGDNKLDGMTEEVGPNLKISVDHATEAGYAIRGPATRWLDGEPISLESLDGLTLGRMQFDGMSATIPTGGSYEIRSVSISELAFDQGFLKSGSFRMDGMKLSAADLADARAKAGFQQLGLKTLTISFGAGFQWDPDKKAATLHDVDLKIDELGDLVINADLANIGPTAPAANQPVNLTHATIRYEDASLLDRILGAGGQRSPQQVAQIRKQLAANFTQALPQSNPNVAASAKAISDFAATPHSLTITAAPASPIAVQDIKSVAALGLANVINVLGLSAAANQ